MEFAQWGIGVDEEDGVVGGEVGHRGVAAERVLSRHGVNPNKGRIATVLLRNKMGGSYARVRRPED